MSFTEGLSFDDVLLKPRYSEVVPAHTSLMTQLTRRYQLNIPLLSAAMDTVTEADTAIAMAQHGGIGIIHKNLSIAAQAQEIDKVKRKHIGTADNFPEATKDSRGRLLVGAAISPGADCCERAVALLAAGCDVLVIDTAHGHSKAVIDAAIAVKKTCEQHDYDLIVGNIATAEAAQALIAAGADALKVGIGPGSICTTRMVAGIGVPQLTALIDCARVATEHGVPIIADGGVRFSGDILKALAAGAATVMIGSLFAGSDETPGEEILHAGKTYKFYRGMGSLAAMQAGSKDRYQQAAITAPAKLVAEGVEGLVPYRGALADNLQQLVGGLRAGMGYLGVKTISDIPAAAEFVKISPAGLNESHVHDITIAKEAPNYRR